MSDHAKYCPEWVADYYDRYGEQEWLRLTRSPADRVNLHIHEHYLRKFVKPGSRVLEIGAGPGRFTKVLFEINCSVVVSDWSPVQLALNRKLAEEHGFADAVERWERLDVCDLSTLDTDSFDAVLCYGGPLSYVFDRAGVALKECVRVCKPDGSVLISVMSMWGTCHQGLKEILSIPAENNKLILQSGNLCPENWEGAAGHRCHMFRSEELRKLAESARVHVAAMSSSNSLSLRWNEELSTIANPSEEWTELLRMELEACAEAGCLDMGTHIILVGIKELNDETYGQ